MNNSQRYKQLETVLVLVLAMAILYWLYKNPLFLLVSIVTGLAGLFFPAVAKAIHWFWMKLASLMGAIMSKIVLTAIFIVVVVPLGWITRKAGKSSVKLKPGESSYFKERHQLFVKADMENPW